MDGSKKIVSLTSVMSKSPPRKRNIPVDARCGAFTQSNHGLSNEIARIKRIISAYEAENAKISSLLHHLDGALHSVSQRKLLYQDFEAELTAQIERLEQRRKRLVGLESAVNSFKFGDGDVDVETRHPIYIPPKPKLEESPRKRPVTKLAESQQGLLIKSMTRKVTRPTTMLAVTATDAVAPKSASKRMEEAIKTLGKLDDTSSKNNKESLARQELIKENEKLREIALNQERLLLIQKMKLRMCHDHRDLSSLRKILDQLEGGTFSKDEEASDISHCKIKISNLKSKIARERHRITSLGQPKSREEQAALTIQSAARGFLTRLRLAA